MDLKSKIILIAGPTASGKSSFAIKMAQKINGEIINADSMQVYKELKILTARPKKKDQFNIKHHLYGFQSVKKNFSTGNWIKSVLKIIKEIKKRNKIPVLVGGTGLYFKALTHGLVKIPNIPIKYRNKIRNLQKKIGQKKFYNKLLQLDPLIKTLVNPNDIHRTLRAYEVKKFTKISIVEWFKKTKVLFNEESFIKFYIDFPRPDLIKKINQRIEKMFAEGAIREVKNFLSLKVRKDNSSNKVIGIREISNYLNNITSLSKTKQEMAIKTRQYAKRQTTWARGQMSSWQRINPKNINTLLKNF